MLTKPVLRTVLQTGDQFVCKLFTLFIDDFALWVFALDLVCHGEKQVRFADAARTVDEQGIVGGNVHLVFLVGRTRIERDRTAGGKREPVGFPFDKVLEGVFVDD